MLNKEYDKCMLCPRKCMVKRNEMQKGICGESQSIRIARAALHFWEEPCISGKCGSGTVFFSGCSLKCIFCQNYSLSRGEKGRIVTESELCEEFIKLQEQGAHNINLVTAEHFAPGIRSALLSAKEKGLRIPVILNSSGYVGEKALEILKDVVDIYLVDFKYIDSNIAEEFSGVKNYPEVAKNTLKRMVQMKPSLCFDEYGMLKSGVIVRHLCLPGCTKDSKNVIEYVFKKYKDRVKISIMSQYTPMPQCKTHPLLKRKLSEKEYANIIDYCIDIGIEDAYIQEGESASESFIPEFQ